MLRSSISGGDSIVSTPTQPSVLVTPRYGAGAVIVGPAFYALGGYGAAGITNNIEGLSITSGSFGVAIPSSGLTLSTARSQFSSIVLGNYVYAWGGEFFGGAATTNVERCTLP